MGLRLTVSARYVMARLLLHNTQTPKTQTLIPLTSQALHLSHPPQSFLSLFPPPHAFRSASHSESVWPAWSHDSLRFSRAQVMSETTIRRQISSIHSPANLLLCTYRRIPLNKLNSYHQSPLHKQPPLLWGIGPAVGLHMHYWAFEKEPVVGLLSQYKYFSSWC